MPLKTSAVSQKQEKNVWHMPRGKNYEIINKMLIGKANTGYANNKNKNFKLLIARRQTIVIQYQN